MESRNISHLRGVDHLRAFAAVLIVLYHGTQLVALAPHAAIPAFIKWPKASNPFSALLMEGHTAVALFMVLSGFIFAYGADGKEIKYLQFLRNRFLRTYPLFVFLIVVGVTCYPNSLNLNTLVLTLLSFADIPPVRMDLHDYSVMFWTLGVEWKFYVIFPFLIRAMQQRPVGYLLTALALLLGVRALCLSLGAEGLSITYWSILGRLDQFLLGMAAGIAYHRYGAARFRYGLLLAAPVVLGSLWQFNAMGGHTHVTAYRSLWMTWEGAMWSAFVLSYLAVDRRVPSFLNTSLSAIGRWSYSTYLWHFPVLALFRAKGWYWAVSDDVFVSSLCFSVVVLLPTILAASALSYTVIEQPFLRLRGSYV